MSRHPDVAITLTIGPRPPRRRLSHAWKGRFQLTLEGDDVAGWTIRCGDEVAIDCDPQGTALDCTCQDHAQTDILREILARRVLPRLSVLHGRLPIHGASLANGDGAVLMLGASGAGKSTLTAALAGAGWDILSDDMSILSGPGDPCVWQTAPGVSVWEPSRRGLALPRQACRPIKGYDGKFWYAPVHRRRADSVPVKAMLFLSNDAGGAVEWRRETGGNAAVTTASQMVRFNPADRDETARALDRLTRLAARTPCYTLSYPRSYAMLPKTIEAVAAIHEDAQKHARL